MRTSSSSVGPVEKAAAGLEAGVAEKTQAHAGAKPAAAEPHAGHSPGWGAEHATGPAEYSLKMTILLAGLMACAPPTPEASATGAPHVLVVVLDGVRVEEFTSDWTSDLTGVSGEDNAQRTWSEVVPHGTVVRSILNPVLTSTAPGHAALVSGRAEPLLNVGFGHQGPALYRPLLPTIFEEARSQTGWSADDAVLMANSVVMSGVNASIYPGLEDFGGTWSMVTEPMKTAVEDDDTRTFALLEDLLASDAPQLLVVNFHDADRAAHLVAHVNP